MVGWWETRKGHLPLPLKTNAALGWLHTSERQSPRHHFTRTSCEQSLQYFQETTAKWQQEVFVTFDRFSQPQRWLASQSSVSGSNGNRTVLKKTEENNTFLGEKCWTPF